jgi:tripartite-type tricarboxylate transporter receptor subunit TctC
MAATSTRMISVPYRGFQQTVLDVMSGRLAMTFESVANFLPFTRDGQVRLVAVSSEQRVASLPDIPTFAEFGYPQLIVESWLAVWAPAGTPPDIIARLNRAVRLAVANPSFRALAASQVQLPASSTPEALAALTAEDVATWRQVITPLNLQTE